MGLKRWPNLNRPLLATTAPHPDLNIALKRPANLLIFHTRRSVPSWDAPQPPNQRAHRPAAQNMSERVIIKMPIPNLSRMAKTIGS